MASCQKAAAQLAGGGAAITGANGTESTTRPHPGRSKQGVLEPRTLTLINAQSFGPLTSDICRGMARAWFELSFSGRAAGIRAAA